jgi:hypothetical protein
MKSGEIRTDQIKSDEIKLTASKIRPGRTYSGRPAAVPRTDVGIRSRQHGREQVTGGSRAGGSSTGIRSRQHGRAAAGSRDGAAADLQTGGGWVQGRGSGDLQRAGSSRSEPRGELEASRSGRDEPGRRDRVDEARSIGMIDLDPEGRRDEAGVRTENKAGVSDRYEADRSGSRKQRPAREPATETGARWRL